MSDKSPLASKSALWPKRAREMPEQVDIHHEVIGRHAREFVEHADWITAVHQRVSDLEEKDTNKELQEFRTQFQIAIARVQAVMWTFGVVWTVLVTVGGVVVALVLKK
jgi:hypothetical protein